MRLERKIVAIVAVLIIAVLLGACAGGSDSGADGASVGTTGGGAGGGGQDLSLDAMPVEEADQSMGQRVLADEEAGGGVQMEPYQEREPLNLGASVIKTADMRLEVAKDDFDSAVREATIVAERYGGFIVSSAVDDSDRGSASATLRVPANSFGTALAALRKLGTVEREEISGEDVSQELIDLAARLRNYRAQERVLLNLMAEAQSVADTIRVQNELSGIQLEVERLRGRLRYLDDRVTFSTIFVLMNEKGAPPPPKSGVIQEAWDNAVEGFFAVIGSVIVAAGVLVPIGVLALLAFLGIRWLRPRVIRRLGSEKA